MPRSGREQPASVLLRPDGEPCLVAVAVRVLLVEDVGSALKASYDEDSGQQAVLPFF